MVDKIPFQAGQDAVNAFQVRMREIDVKWREFESSGKM